MLIAVVLVKKSVLSLLYVKFHEQFLLSLLTISEYEFLRLILKYTAEPWSTIDIYSAPWQN